MANTHSPTSGTHLYLPRWAYQVLALACMAMGLWASGITLQYFEHGAKALESDPALQALAVAAALMFVASEMGAFALAALLSERQLWARRWALTLFAAAVLGLEVVTIVAVQLALTTGADMTQATVTTSVAGLQRQIDAVEKNAAAFATTAEALRADKQVSKAMRASDKAAAEQAKAAALYAELARVQTQKRPTLVGLLGHDNAIYYAVARGILVSLGGLVFFGTAGALLRAARAGTVQAVSTQAPAREPVSYKSASVSYSKGAMLAAMGSAAIAQTAPATPVVSGVLKQAHAESAGVLKQAHKKTRPAVAAGAKIDTGTTGKAAARYNRVRAGVAAGSLKPSVRAIQAAEGGGTLVVRSYIKQLAADGVIVQAGRGYVLAQKGGAQ